ncbi:MAG: 3-oxoacyl-ACP reductase FabG [Chloroflexi bacterium]|nr:3-oxoacyl-ACP reductase FabG [Chloroflexota bacterium]
MHRLQDKVAIITGAGQGIGQVYAERMGEEGAKVVVAEVNPARGEAVAERLHSRGQDTLAVATDVSSEESVKAMVEAALREYGRIDILVNNAAIFHTIKMKPFEEISLLEWQQLMAVNVTGVFLCCKWVIPVMKKQNRGKVINISSGVVFGGRPFYLHYVTSKAGIIGLTRGLAREVGDWNINVNTITPGPVVTEVPRETVSPEQAKALLAQKCFKRAQVPADLVGALMFLASDESDYITGQLINVDGGLAMH